MKKFVLILMVALFVAGCSNPVLDEGQDDLMLKKGKVKTCVTLQDGIIKYSAGHYLAGQPIPVGYDAYGYNYQAMMYNGNYANAYLGRYGFPPYNGDDESYIEDNPDVLLPQWAWFWDYRNDKVMMKWSEEWLSNMDCNGDGKLDRGYKCNPVVANNSLCEGAWLTNHMSGVYEDGDDVCKWTYFCKIITPPANATLVGGIWIGADGVEIGPDTWSGFATIQEVSNDPCNGDHGILYKSPDHAGFGGW
jgi:hypothetical protein